MGFMGFPHDIIVGEVVPLEVIEVVSAFVDG